MKTEQTDVSPSQACVHDLRAAIRVASHAGARGIYIYIYIYIYICGVRLGQGSARCGLSGHGAFGLGGVGWFWVAWA